MTTKDGKAHFSGLRIFNLWSKLKTSLMVSAHDTDHL